MTVEQRLAPRHALYLWAMSRRYGATDRLKIIVKDLSRTGFRIRSPADYDIGDLIFVEFDQAAEAEAWVVRQHPSLPDYGCQFRAALSQQDVDRIIRNAAKKKAMPAAA